MSLWRAIKNFVARSDTAHADVHLKAEKRLFDYLIGLVNRPDMIADDIAVLKRINNIRTKREKVFAYVQLYFRLETFLLANKPLVTKKEFNLAENLRKEIALHIPVDDLSMPVRLIFLPPNKQAAALFDIALPELIVAMRHNLGQTALDASLVQATRGTILAGVALESDMFDFSQVSAKIVAVSASETQFAFKKVYDELFGKVEQMLGHSSATIIAEKMYETIAKNFNQALLSLFLNIIPENFLVSQRLFVLSREELQKRVIAATEDLRRLNESLEDKVRERTKELTDANIKLQELDNVKTEFVSIAAHQLRTPATKLKWIINIILDDPNAPQSAYLEKIRSASRSIDQLVNLINDLLDISRIEEGNWGIELVRRSFDALVRDVCVDAKEAATAKKISFSLKMQPEIPELDLDRTKILIVLNNLLDNAIKYTNSGGSIICEVTRDGDRITTTVRDNGIGIQQAEADRIFSKFYRSDGARNLYTEGAGLGLFVTKKIIELHHGEIGFESTLGKGSAFYFSLPIPKQ